MNGRFESQSFFHIVENISQDTSAVVRITVHTLRSLKEENPIIDTASLRQDNAGCYVQTPPKNSRQPSYRMEVSPESALPLLMPPLLLANSLN